LKRRISLRFHADAGPKNYLLQGIKFVLDAQHDLEDLDAN